MIRSLKMLVLPLVAGCMIASVCALGEAGSGMGRTAAWTLGTFFVTTSISSGLGVMLAVVVHPGRAGDLSASGSTHPGCVVLGASTMLHAVKRRLLLHCRSLEAASTTCSS